MVTQAGLNATLDASTMVINLPATAGTDGTFDITSNIMWDIATSVGWLNGWNTLNGMGDETITFSYDANNSGAARSTTIVISGSGLEKIITVNLAVS